MLILGAWGIVTEIVSVFSGKPIFSYRGVILSFLLITALSFSVWAHHMFATGAVELPFFSVTTELISIPTGVLFFIWLGTMWKGKLRFEPPMLFALGFIAMFLIGGINGVWAASPAMDFAIHDTYWVVAHLHYVLFGGTIFGVMAGMYYWFPKMTGRMLSRKLGIWQFWLQLVGFNLTFFPMHMLGLQGMPRRIADYAPDRGWSFLNLMSSIGAFVIAIAMIVFFVNIFLTLRKPRSAPDDPWGSNTLEWATSSPPPHTTSTPCRRSARIARRTTYAWPRRSRRHERGHGAERASLAGDERAGHGDGPVRRVGGDVLCGILRRLLHDQRQRQGVAASWDPDLEIGIATVLTVILVTSSLVVQLSLRSIRRDDRRRAILFLGVTIALGIAFLLLQLYDYSQLGFGVKDGTFGTLFYVMTGIHMAHVFGGVVFLSLVFGQAMGGVLSSTNHDSLAAGAIYWDFVDVVWLLLFTTFYLLLPR